MLATASVAFLNLDTVTSFRNILQTLVLTVLGVAVLSGEEQLLETDLLIVGGDEAGCAAAVQAARLGVEKIILTNDVQWLGGQFSTQGIGPVDEWTRVDGRTCNFPRSGPFLEIIRKIRAHNRKTYGIGSPGNAWCGTETIEPRTGARIFEEWLGDYSDQIKVLRPWRPVGVDVQGNRVRGVRFEDPTKSEQSLRIMAKLVVDSSDWGDVIRRSGASYMAGPDLKSRFSEPGAPEKLEEGGHQEMNPITWCPILRETVPQADSLIPKPVRYDRRSFALWDADWSKCWRDWDGSGGIYNAAGWCMYTSRRMVDRYHNGLKQGTEAVILNWPAHDYPLSTLPQHVVDALEKDEVGASRKNIVDMTYRQREIVYEDAKQRALEFVYYLQTVWFKRDGDIPQSFRYMKLGDDFGTADKLPPKPYVREGLRLDALHIVREQDVRTEHEQPGWAKVMVPDGVFGWQFSLDFHPTRRKFVDDDPTQPWEGKHHGTRNWSTHADRSMFPLRGLVPVEMDGLLGCSKNIGVSSMVQSALRLHGQMMHVGTAAGTVAWLALHEGVQPREVATTPKWVREVQLKLVSGAGGPGTLIWPWHDLDPDDAHFEAANMLTIAGIWKPDPDSLFFSPHQIVTHGELAGIIARLSQSKSPAIENEAAEATWGTLHQWLLNAKLESFPSLTGKKEYKDQKLTRAQCIDFLYRVHLRSEVAQHSAGQE